MSLSTVLALAGIVLTLSQPIYASQLEDWWASRSKRRLRQRIGTLEQEAATVQETDAISTAIVIVVVAINNLFLITLNIAIGLVETVLGMVEPKQHIFLGVGMSYWFAMIFFAWAVINSLRSSVHLGRGIRRIRGSSYEAKLKASLERLKAKLKAQEE